MTPLARFVNTRILLTLPGERLGPETGFRVAPGGKLLAWATMRQPKPSDREHLKQLYSADASLDILSGFLVGWAPLPPGALWQTVALASLPNADTSGYRHPAIMAGAEIQISNPPRFSASAQLVESAGQYGDEGIGSLVRQRIGDRLIVKVNWLA
jgi:hypothetical protein